MTKGSKKKVKKENYIADCLKHLKRIPKLAESTANELKVLAVQIEKQRTAAIKAAIHDLEFNTADKEDAVKTAEKQIDTHKFANGKKIVDRVKYVSNILELENDRIKAVNDLEAHLDKIKFLKKQLEA